MVTPPSFCRRAALLAYASYLRRVRSRSNGDISTREIAECCATARMNVGHAPRLPDYLKHERLHDSGALQMAVSGHHQTE
jgi:hypothetical protein